VDKRNKPNEANKAIKQKLLYAAMDLFSKYGYASTPMRDIAAEVGVSDRIAHSHFPTKSALLDGILDYFMKVASGFVPPKESVARLTKDATTDDVMACLYIYFPKDEEPYYIKALHLLFQEHIRNNDVRAFFANNMILWQEGYIANVLGRLVDAGAISDEIDIDHWARLHASVTYTFIGRHVMGIGDMLPNFEGRNMKEMLRANFDHIFQLYGNKSK
jgi:AcrR family transcriptional regulator